ncbi:MAG: hypothetical protein E7283_09035 [Lachnospiraceae bacterium]|nr:hypothetical protein [Lachnospiraceae bacterium]
MALSNFLCNKEGRKTAYIELNASNEICCLTHDSRLDCFSHMGITIFPHRTFTSLAEILHMDYDYFILDMGVLNSYSAKEFAKFERQFLICSLTQWKKRKTSEKLVQLLETICIPPECITILSNCEKKESTLQVSPTVFFPVVSIPFIENPFHLTLEFLSPFYKISGLY